MKLSCPEIYCPKCLKKEFKKMGNYLRKDDGKKIQRFLCLACKKSFSRATFSYACGQKKRRENSLILQLFVAGVSMRTIAKITKLNKNSIKGKLIYWSKVCAAKHKIFLEDYVDGKITLAGLDDLITSEHTKLKPLSVPVVVAEPKRYILGTGVAKIPAFGHLAKISREKYGIRPNEHPEVLSGLLDSLKPHISPNAQFKSDAHHLYPELIKKHYPESTHKTFKSSRGCVTGQSELKEGRFDPLFSINHTLAMLRANISRLMRRTWNTTKDPKMLQHHLNIYVFCHNWAIYQKETKALAS